MFNMYDYNNQMTQIPQMQQKPQNTASAGVDILYVPDLRSVDNVQNENTYGRNGRYVR